MFTLSLAAYLPPCTWSLALTSVSSILMVRSDAHLHDIISLGQVGGQLAIVGQSPELC